jgi:hypothetical protein
MANEYATLAELKATLSMSGETFADADVSLALAAASRAIDNTLDRRFWLDADATQVRYYTPSGGCSFPIDDLVALTALATDNDADGTFENAWTVNADFVLEPLNAEADGWPWTSVKVHPRGAHALPSDPRSVRVTGRFGWPAVPDPIKDATMILAGRLMRRAREAPFGVVAPGLDAGAAMHIARTDPDVQLLISPYARMA